MVLKAAGATDSTIEKVEIVEALLDAVHKAAVLGPDLLGQVGADVMDEVHRQVIKALGPDKAKEATSMTDEFDPSTLSPEALAYVEAQIAKAAPAAEDVDPEAEALAKAMDGLPEPIRKHLAKQADEVRIAKAAAAAERDIRLNAEYLQKAQGFKHLAAKPEELATTLRKVADLDPMLYVEVERLLKSADEVAGAGDLFKSVGSGAVPTTDSAAGQMEALAKSKVAAGEASDLGTALAAVAGENPDLYARYRTEAMNPSQEG